MAYDATYAFTHLLQTLQATSGGKFDATTAVSGALRAVAAGGQIPAVVPAAVVKVDGGAVVSAAVAAAVERYRVETPKSKDDKR